MMPNALNLRFIFAAALLLAAAACASQNIAPPAATAAHAAASNPACGVGAAPYPTAQAPGNASGAPGPL